MLTVSNVSVSFTGKKLYDDVNLKFTPGNTYGIIGANGAGKSTFLKVLEGKLQPTTGNVSMGPNERMSSLVQDHFAFDEFTVLDTVLKGHKELYDVKTEMDGIYMHDPFTDEDGIRVGELSARFEELDGWTAETEAVQLLQSIGIPESKHQALMSDLPEVSKVKVLLAQALFGNPDILILDEPTNGLDPEGIKEMRELLVELAEKENMAILISSHNLAELDTFCNKICIIKNGKIIETSDIDKIRHEEREQTIIFMVDNTKNISQIFANKNYGLKMLNEKQFKINVEEEEIPKVVVALVKNNVKVYEIKHDEKSLEQAFLEKTGGNVIE